MERSNLFSIMCAHKKGSPYFRHAFSSISSGFRLRISSISSHSSSICFCLLFSLPFAHHFCETDTFSKSKMEFTRSSVVVHLEKIRGILPTDKEYREQIEKYILLHYDLMYEELASPKKFRAYCSSFATKARDYYQENERHVDRMLEDSSHKVVLALHLFFLYIL